MRRRAREESWVDYCGLMTIGCHINTGPMRRSYVARPVTADGAVAFEYGAFAGPAEFFRGHDQSTGPGRAGAKCTKGRHNMTVRQRFATLLVACALLFGGAVTFGVGSASAASAATRVEAATSDEISVAAASALAAMGTNQFPVLLSNVASAAAQRLEVDSGRLFTAWATADRPHQIALLSALTQVGVPYRRNASKVGVAFDCSGLTLWAWSQSGVALAHNSTRQLRTADARTRDTAEAGDLVYYPGHVMLWLGVDDYIVHAPQRGVPVEVGQISNRRVKRAKFGDPLG